jgi:tetratricopeptide (TPR) repeat protein
MFTINIYLRFALMGLLIIGGLVLTFIPGFGFWYALPFLLTGIILLVGYVMLGTVQSAAPFMQDNDFEAADKRLNLTLTPKLLYSTNRAYYYMIKGSIELAKKNMDKSEEYLRLAEAIEVPSDNEKAMLQLQLANIAASKNNWKKAQLHFRSAKQLKVTEEAIKDQLKMFEKAIANRGQAKAAARMGNKGMQQGLGKSKRRRPKMK